MRSLVDDLPFAVFGAPKRVYLFDECHRMSKDAQDVLLKPLEEKRMLGMFCTTEPEKIRAAIRTRCEEHQIRKITREDILGRMQMVLRQESVQFEDDAVLTVIDYCAGSVRDILNKLEMISQMGPVSMEAARSYLNLSIISTYYEILLALPDRTKEALELVDRACDRVTPEEVANGLAEAAMNSFRLANGMMADFAYADRSLGQKVYETYRDQIIKVTEFFVRSRYSSRVGLTCDLVTIAQSLRGGSLPTYSIPAAPVFTPVTTQTQVISAPAPASTPSEVRVEAAAPSTETPPQVPASASPKPSPTPKPGVRSDGIGNLGQDPLALTEVDAFGVPRKTVKTSTAHQPVPLNFGNDTRTGDESRKILTPLEWRRQFEECISNFYRGASHGSA
jgi:DNA polymerase III gamma/tau subunit